MPESPIHLNSTPQIQVWTLNKKKGSRICSKLNSFIKGYWALWVVCAKRCNPQKNQPGLVFVVPQVGHFVHFVSSRSSALIGRACSKKLRARTNSRLLAWRATSKPHVASAPPESIQTSTPRPIEKHSPWAETAWPLLQSKKTPDLLRCRQQ